MQDNSSFQMEIQDPFVLKGSLVISGMVASGRVCPGDEITIQGEGTTLQAKVVDILKFAQSLPAAEAGDQVGLVIEGVELSQVARGMRISLTAEEIEGAEAAVEPADLLITCAACNARFDWKDSFKCTDTPGAARHTISQGDYLPRVFCPQCGQMILEWHITESQDFDQWRWAGENEKINPGRAFPPAANVYGWGISIPPDYLPGFDQSCLDVVSLRASTLSGSDLAEDDLLRLYESIPELDPRTADLDTALFMAAVHGLDEVIPVLVSAGANPNFKAPTGWTPLMQAARAGHANALQALLAAGADPNNQDVFAAHTPLILAAKGGHGDVIRALLSSGADPGRKNQWGETALQCAAGQKDLQELLSNSGAGEFDHLTAELIEIYRADGFLTDSPRDKFNKDKRNIRAIEIGERLNEMGGKKMMQHAYSKFKGELGGIPARELEWIWDGVGEWLG